MSKYGPTIPAAAVTNMPFETVADRGTEENSIWLRRIGLIDEAEKTAAWVVRVDKVASTERVDYWYEADELVTAMEHFNSEAL